MKKLLKRIYPNICYFVKVAKSTWNISHRIFIFVDRFVSSSHCMDSTETNFVELHLCMYGMCVCVSVCVRACARAYVCIVHAI